MYIDHWALDRSPFAAQLNPEDFFASATHEEALARLQFLIENGRRLGFLLGATGTGKSLLLEVAARQLRQNGCHVVKINLLGLSGSEFVWTLASGLGHLASTDASPVECWRGISDRLAANRYQRITTVVLLDDAEDCEDAVYSAISRLALTEQRPESRITLVLASQRQRSRSFGAKLNEMCDLRLDIIPWNGVETTEYIQDALLRVGGTTDTFSDRALERIHELTQGVPRRVRQLAELSLVAAAADGTAGIEADVIDAVYQSLDGRNVTEAA
ncbi:MAG: AAA family ATPase [Planctomycetaceae bacterium]|nr:AAA family ATPase [Planctomycetaceae bacterium]